jgi:hypothetical protein
MKVHTSHRNNNQSLYVWSMNNMPGAFLEVQQMAMSVHTRRSEEVVSQRKMPGIIIAFNALLHGRAFSANERLNDVSTDMTES